MILNFCDVIYFDEPHRYILDGVELSGITSVIKKHLFPDMYSNTPDGFLERAKERGTKVHKECEDFFNRGTEPTSLLGMDFKRLTKEFVHVASEYTVSDEAHFASNIDLVFDDNGKAVLADIKTTHDLHEEYLRWQLSIYAYLFELINPDIEVGKLLGVWLKQGKSQIIEIDRIPTEEVKRLLQCEIDGTKFIPTLPIKADEPLPKEFADAQQKIVEIITLADEYERQAKELREGLRTAMEKAGVVKWKGDKISCTLSKDTKKMVFDEKRFIEEHPDVYQEYLKEKTTKGRFILKIN